MHTSDTNFDRVRVSKIDGRALFDEIVDYSVHTRFVDGVLRFTHETAIHVKIGRGLDCALEFLNPQNVEMTLYANAASILGKLEMIERK